MTSRYAKADEWGIWMETEPSPPPFRPNMALIGYIGGTRKRRARRVSELPPPPASVCVPPKTPQEELHEALRDYLYDMLRYALPPPRQWVMSLEWWNEVRKISEPWQRSWTVPALSPDAFETLLGIPVEIRAGAVPDIEAAP